MPVPDENDLNKYLGQKRKRLEEIRGRLSADRAIDALFSRKNWYGKVEEQLRIWESDPRKSFRERDISVPEYELFRYFEDGQILDRFIASFSILEESICPDRTRYRKWRESKLRLFSKQISQIYSVLFEILILGELASVTSHK